MNTRALAARLKRLEFRSGPPLERTQIEICLVDSKAKVLYKMRLGPGENQYFSVDDQPISREKRRIAEARKRGELPPAEEGRPLTEFDQWRLEILKQAAWHAKLRADRRAKM